MKTFQKLLEPPSVPKILEILSLRPDGVPEEEIADFVGKDHGERTIPLLIGYGVIERSEGVLRIVQGPENLERIHSITRFFRKIQTATEVGLMIRGILTANVYFQCLVHLGTLIDLVAEGGSFSRDDVVKAVSAEERLGYIERRLITYRARGSLKERFFAYVPLHHFDDFVSVTGRHVEQVEEGACLPEDRITFVKEEYILGNYPAQLAEQGRNFTEERCGHLLSRVRNESFDLIWWYDRY